MGNIYAYVMIFLGSMDNMYTYLSWKFQVYSYIGSWVIQESVHDKKSLEQFCHSLYLNFSL